MIRLVEGDCLEVMQKMIDQNYKVDLIVTDPPYLMNYKTSRRKDKSHDFCSPIDGDSSESLIQNFIEKSFYLLKDNSAMYVFCNQNRVDFFKKELEKFFLIKNMIIWVKNNHTAGDLKGQFGKQYEIVFLCNKGRREFNGYRLTDVWHFDKVVGKEQLHQNQKPLGLIETMIEKHSNRGDVVLDLFMGSGTTGVAAVITKRDFIGIEIDPDYIKIAKARVKHVIQNQKQIRRERKREKLKKEMGI